MFIFFFSPFWSYIQIVSIFTIHHVFPFFCYLSSVHAIWEVWITKVPEHIVCITACIVVCYLHCIYSQELRKEGFTIQLFFHVSHLHFYDGEQKAASHGFSEHTRHAHKVCLTEQSILFYLLTEKKRTVSTL